MGNRLGGPTWATRGTCHCESRLSGMMRQGQDLDTDVSPLRSRPRTGARDGRTLGEAAGAAAVSLTYQAPALPRFPATLWLSVPQLGEK
jgi:hypothetical protein